MILGISSTASGSRQDCIQPSDSHGQDGSLLHACGTPSLNATCRFIPALWLCHGPVPHCHPALS